MLTPDQFEQLVEKVKRLERQEAEVEGGIQTVLDSLEQEFGVRTLGELEQIMADLQDERNEILSKYNQARIAFDKQWGDKLS